ncbi:uncharacterized protein LOC109714100 [Ananas comosus]|uniref:Uncharacterized protein LOC109714100 n=1 Tax=Ananas comosus TaxID=4615 RepID=A0A6P5FEU4_ANACO|nr:uncharacterized protein LOC109714100 [Ananas comosus]
MTVLVGPSRRRRCGRGGGPAARPAAELLPPNASGWLQARPPASGASGVVGGVGSRERPAAFGPAVPPGSTSRRGRPPRAASRRARPPDRARSAAEGRPGPSTVSVARGELPGFPRLLASLTPLPAGPPADAPPSLGRPACLGSDECTAVPAQAQRRACGRARRGLALRVCAPKAPQLRPAVGRLQAARAFPCSLLPSPEPAPLAAAARVGVPRPARPARGRSGSRARA